MPYSSFNVPPGTTRLLPDLPNQVMCLATLEPLEYYNIYLYAPGSEFAFVLYILYVAVCAVYTSNE